MLFIVKTVKRPNYWTSDPEDTDVVFIYPYGDTMPQPLEITAREFMDVLGPVLPEDCIAWFLEGKDEFSPAIDHKENQRLITAVRDALDVYEEESFNLDAYVGY